MINLNKEQTTNLSSGTVLAAGGMVITLLVIAWICTPLLVLLALNTLFPVLAIPYNFYTWLATAFLWWVSSRKTIVNLFNK